MIRYLLILFLGIALSPVAFGQNADREAFDACKGVDNVVDEYICLSDYLRRYPRGNYRAEVQKRISALDRDISAAFANAVKKSEKAKNCDALAAFARKYAYSQTFVNQAEAKKREICGLPDPCLSIKDYDNLYLEQCLDILGSASASESCKDRIRERIRAIELTFYNAPTCDNARSYLEKFPNGQYKSLMDSIVLVCSDSSEMAWRNINRKSLRELRNFEQEYPQSRWMPEVRKILLALDNESWARAQKNNSSTGYEEYLRKFPNGAHAAEARTAIQNLKLEETSEEDTAFKTAMASGQTAPLERFLETYPKSKYLDIVRKEIKRLSPGKYAITKQGNAFVVLLENLDNPRILNQSELSDSLLVDATQLKDNTFTLTPLQEGIFRIQLSDDWGKTLLIEINTAKAPFAGLFSLQNDTLTIRFLHELPPYSIVFYPLEGAVGQRKIEVPVDSIFRITKASLYSDYNMEGNYQIIIEKGEAAFAILGDVEVLVPLSYILKFVGLMAALVTTVAVVYWVLRKRMKQKKTLLDEE
ncbi:MAG: hypothetical protein IT260_11750 [Saprospiraceae bacterium]|nr:hypothetical protein [Saprospiraceae bacterium]